jgi:hypothetical protein
MPTMSEINDTGRCAIFTKYLGPTNYRPGRIKARAKSGGKLSVTISYPHELSQSEAHASAAVALCERMKWNPVSLHQGYAPGDGYVFVMGAE